MVCVQMYRPTGQQGITPSGLLVLSVLADAVLVAHRVCTVDLLGLAAAIRALNSSDPGVVRVRVAEDTPGCLLGPV